MYLSTFINVSYTYLSQRIRKFLDGAKDGAVVISLGTNVAWKAIGLEKLKAVVLALSQLKQRVIWKLKTEVPLEMPNNVMVVEWMPQNDILSMSIIFIEKKNIYRVLEIF